MVMKTLEDEQYIVIKAYKFTVFEIWRDFNVLPYVTLSAKIDHFVFSE